MSNVWPNIEEEAWYGRCVRCDTVLGPFDSGIEAEVEVDFHCPGDGGGILVTVGGGPTDNLYAEVN